MAHSFLAGSLGVSGSNSLMWLLANGNRSWSLPAAMKLKHRGGHALRDLRQLRGQRRPACPKPPASVLCLLRYISRSAAAMSRSSDASSKARSLANPMLSDSL